jgi:hypothetical protein
VPSLNNTGDAIVVRDVNSSKIDSVSYLPAWGGNSGGKSLERISVDQLSNDPANWSSSISLNKATPGTTNSITPKDNDLTISSFKSLTEFGIVGEEIQFEVVAKNIGLNPSTNFVINLYRDANQDSVIQQSELISSQSGNSINQNDSSAFNFITNNFVSGKNIFIAFVEISVDDDSTNNKVFANVNGVFINEERNDIVINEIMYAPDSPQPEWIEIFNRSNKTIDLKNYQLADAGDTVKVINQSKILNSNEFFVIAKDSTIFNYFNINSGFVIAAFPSLNNSEDKIVLLDSLNRVIDSLHYYSRWGGTNGKSLERIDVNISSIDSSNWKTSLNIFNATPGNI